MGGIAHPFRRDAKDQGYGREPAETEIPSAQRGRGDLVNAGRGPAFGRRRAGGIGAAGFGLDGRCVHVSSFLGAAPVAAGPYSAGRKPTACQARSLNPRAKTTVPLPVKTATRR